MNLIKHLLFIFFLFIFLTELVMNRCSFFSPKPLIGSVINEAKPELSLDSWGAGTFQESFMKYYEQTLSIRPFLVRINNQIAYSLFNKIKVIYAEQGKQELLYEDYYIVSYLGKSFAGDSVIKQNIGKLSFIQAKLKKQNICLLIAIAPDKPSYFPEYFPEKYNKIKKTRSNYDAYIEQFEKQQINFIDYRKTFLNLKHFVKYPLFPRNGSHWSGYGAMIAADTLFKKMERLKGIDLIDFYDKGGEVTDIPRGTDNDIGDAMNLICEKPSYKMYYPNIAFKSAKGKTKPNVLVIGDSFNWGFIDTYPFYPTLFDKKSAFWYYNNIVWWCGNNNETNMHVSDLNFKNEIKDRDYILILFNDPNTNNCSFRGFVDQLYNLVKTDTLFDKK